MAGSPIADEIPGRSFEPVIYQTAPNPPPRSEADDAFPRSAKRPVVLVASPLPVGGFWQGMGGDRDDQ